MRFFECPAITEPKAEIPLTGFPEVPDPARSSVVLVADPFSFPVDAFLSTFDELFPGVTVMGGMASGAAGPGQCLLFTADGVRDGGAIGVVLEGGVRLHPVVSQGCRPIGKPWVITACERNWIQKLGGRPALEVLMETWNGLPPEDQARLGAAPFLGLAPDASRSRFERGDFLVRGIMSLHQSDRAFAVADFVRRGQTVQLLVRDAESATVDLEQLMQCRAGGAPPEDADPQALGALIFTCNGRGVRMFSRPDHDVGCVSSVLGTGVPIAGLFAAGEIGPVGERNFLHGFTASVAVFRQESDT
jgi:small ligand-binding sensory domain FIST